MIIDQGINFFLKISQVNFQNNVVFTIWISNLYSFKKIKLRNNWIFKKNLSKEWLKG
jgi:hypothetical protein